MKTKPNELKPKTAVFDFDGTLVAKDTLVSLLSHGFKTQPWRVIFLLLFCPIIITTVLLKLDRSIAKSVMLWSVTCFKTKKQTVNFLTKSVKKECENLWFKEGVPILHKLYEENKDIIIATASGQIWIRALLREKFPKAKMIIGTKLRFFMGGVILASKNCRNHEKLRRIREQLGSDFDWESSWSDHTADLPILKAATNPYIVSPKDKHLETFKKEFGEHMKVLIWKA